MKKPELYLGNLLNRTVTVEEVATAMGYSRQRYAYLRDRSKLPFERVRKALRDHFGLTEEQEFVALVELGYLNASAVRAAVRHGGAGLLAAEEDATHPPRRPRLKKGEIDPDAVNNRDLL